MKIRFLLPSNGIAGGLYVVYTHAHYLVQQGHDVGIIFSSSHLGLAVTCFPGFIVPVVSLEDARRSNERYEVVISTWWETFYEMFHLDAQTYLYFCQSDERRFYPSDSPLRPFIEATYRNVNIGILTEARWIKHWLEQAFGARVAYAPNGVDTKLFHPGVAPLAPASPRLRVLIEGPGAVAFKRVDLAFRVTNALPDVEVWLVSSDGHIDPNWRFERCFSQVPLANMPRIYRSCDVLLKLSTVEGFFGPPLEMMATGGTAVVARVTGYDEYVVDGQNALVVDIDDERGARAALERLISDRAFLYQLKAGGLATAQSMDWLQRCPLFEQAVRSLVAEARPVPADVAAAYLQILESNIRTARPSQMSWKKRLGGLFRRMYRN